MSDWNEKFASAWLTIRKKAGACAANTDLEELKAAVQLGQKRVDQALMFGNMAQGQSGVFDKLSKANEGLGKVGESLEKVQDFCVDITAVGKIHDAIVALSDDRIIYDDPQRAADSFDLLFRDLAGSAVTFRRRQKNGPSSSRALISSETFRRISITLILAASVMFVTRKVRIRTIKL
jgi:hypothetical protein